MAMNGGAIMMNDGVLRKRVQKGIIQRIQPMKCKNRMQSKHQTKLKVFIFIHSCRVEEIECFSFLTFYQMKLRLHVTWVSTEKRPSEYNFAEFILYLGPMRM